MTPGTRLAICLPCRDIVNTGFAYDLARLSAYWAAKHVPRGGKLHMFTSQGTLIADQRENLVKEALAVQADYVLWIDTDMRFPKDAADRLASHNLPIVAANYATRRVPCRPVAFADASCTNLVPTQHDSSGLQEVYAVGMGLMLVDTKVYANVPRPWHHIGFSQKADDFYGEDVYFCHQARAKGHKVFIDHDLSKEVRHIGNFEFTHDHVEACVEAVKEAGGRDGA